MSIAPFPDPRFEPWRGVRAGRYTYVRKLDGPWLLYDNREDPYQLENLLDSPRFGDLQRELDHLLNRMLAVRGMNCFHQGRTWIASGIKSMKRALFLTPDDLEGCLFA